MSLVHSRQHAEYLGGCLTASSASSVPELSLTRVGRRFKHAFKAAIGYSGTVKEAVMPGLIRAE